jgi:hypothetical protein
MPCLLQLLDSQFQFSNVIFLGTNRLSLYSLGSDTVENIVFFCRVLWCYLATRCSMIHREHRSYCCVFAGTYILSRCLAMGRYITIRKENCVRPKIVEQRGAIYKETPRPVIILIRKSMEFDLSFP